MPFYRWLRWWRTPPAARPIDLHAHVFNLRYLPVVGHLRALGFSDKVARAIYRLLKAIADRQSDPAQGPEAAIAVDTVDRVVETGNEESGRDAICTLVPPSAFDDPEVLSALDEVSPTALRRLAAADLARLRVVTPDRLEPGAVARLIRRGDLPVQAPAILARGLTDDLDWGTFKFMYLLTRPEQRLMDKLATTYPDVEQFVHSMMDMEVHYKDLPEYRFTDPSSANGKDQVSRTLRLMKESKGRFIAFVAWDPFRSNALRIVEDALARGCRGVKFYPSNGFRPIGNLPSDIDADMEDPPTADEVNRRNLELYDHCVRHGAPIFAHCAPGDLEAKRCYDRFADPKLWRVVLEYQLGERRPFETLRLCFAHAGGADAWALPENQEDVFRKSYAGTVHALCSDGRFPNLYADFGMFTPVLDNEKRNNLRSRLERLLIGADGRPTPFASRIVYGSDWSMLYRRQGHERYLFRFREVFSGRLAPLADGFFRNNALRYLGTRR